MINFASIAGGAVLLSLLLSAGACVVIIGSIRVAVFSFPALAMHAPGRGVWNV